MDSAPMSFDNSTAWMTGSRAEDWCVPTGGMFDLRGVTPDMLSPPVYQSESAQFQHSRSDGDGLSQWQKNWDSPGWYNSTLSAPSGQYLANLEQVRASVIRNSNDIRGLSSLDAVLAELLASFQRNLERLEGQFPALTRLRKAETASPHAQGISLTFHPYWTILADCSYGAEFPYHNHGVLLPSNRYDEVDAGFDCGVWGLNDAFIAPTQLNPTWTNLVPLATRFGDLFGPAVDPWNLRYFFCEKQLLVKTLKVERQKWAIKNFFNRLHLMRRLVHRSARPFCGRKWSRRVWSLLHGSHPPKPEGTAPSLALGCA